MRRRGYTVVEFSVLFAGMACFAAAFFTAYVHFQRPRQRVQCQRNMRLVAIAIRQYMRDSDDHFPNVNGHVTAYGWADSIQPYLKDTQLLQCPTDSKWLRTGDTPKTPNYTDYFYNANLSGRNGSWLQIAPLTIMLGESVPGDGRRSSKGVLREKSDIYTIRDSSNAPIGAATRHLDGANYVFVDGHVKWLKGWDSNTTPSVRYRGCVSVPTYELY